MTRIHIICEGVIEEKFIHAVLQKHFNDLDKYLYPCLIGKPGHKGDHVSYERIKFDVQQRISSDKNSYCTTLFDFYGLSPDVPGTESARRQTETVNKYNCFIDEFTKQLSNDLGQDTMNRFIPYVQMYEFEGLLFSNAEILAEGMFMDGLLEKLEKVKSEFDSPEDINDSPITAPSKRLLDMCPTYEKVICGSLVSEQIGLDKIRQECALFNNWIAKLEALEAIN